ncbi:MAG: hypothetical protein BGP01_05625 [Paludibacter sp. 47-17]|nr:MAG: hypothetical protein BGP01_05625 [Paludibacter sp. 47-17]
MKRIILMLLLFNFVVLDVLDAQIRCDLLYDTINNGYRVMSNDLNWSNYTDYDCNNTTIKVVRLTFHIIQKEDGSNNFPNNSTSNEFLSVSTMETLNNSMRENAVMNLDAHLAPFQPDTRIRFELTNIYYWNDDYDNEYRTYYSNYYNNVYYVLYGNYLTAKYVTSRPNVMFKDNSIHVFFCMGGSSAGGHTTLASSKWMVLTNMSTSHPAFTFRTIKHEMGHIMGLEHSWIANDGCDDTPPNPNCWDQHNCDSVHSNNTMDYNNCQCAFTQCQINKMHYYLLGNAGVVNDCIKGDLTFDNPYLQSNSDFLCNGNNNVSIVKSLPFGVTMNWSITPTINNVVTQSTGNTFSMFTDTPIKEIGRITSTLNYGTLGHNDLQKDIYLNGFDDVIISGNYLNNNIVGKNIITNGQSIKIQSGNNIFFYHDESVVLNPGFEVELGGQLSIVKKFDECK